MNEMPNPNLQCGAVVLGPPNSADLPMMIRLADLPARYLKHFLGT